jgi:hypothetical protein
MHGDWAAVSISLIGVDQNCETSNLITRAKGNPGIHHNDSNVGPGPGQARWAAACVRPAGGRSVPKRLRIPCLLHQRCLEWWRDLYPVHTGAPSGQTFGVARILAIRRRGLIGVWRPGVFNRSGQHIPDASIHYRWLSVLGVCHRRYLPLRSELSYRRHGAFRASLLRNLANTAASTDVFRIQRCVERRPVAARAAQFLNGYGVHPNVA